METWILIILLTTGRWDRPCYAIDHIEYTSKTKCLEASKAIRASRDNSLSSNYPLLVFSCTKK